MRRLEQVLGGEVGSVPTARRLVVSALDAWGLEEHAWAAALLVSELTANAALHAGTEFRLVAAALPDGGLRLEVRDGSARLPQRRALSETATTGRGLRLVEELAARWGADPDGTGKTVWVELAAIVPQDDAGDEDDVDVLLGGFADLDDDEGRRAPCARAA